MSEQNEGPACREQAGPQENLHRCLGQVVMSTTEDLQKAIHSPLVQQYVGLGWHCLPLVRHGKKAFQDDWQKRTFDEENLRRHLAMGCNVGVRLDGDLIDLDFDRPEARRLSGYFFPEAPAFRRETLPANAPGHRVLRCSNPSGKTEKFQFTGKSTEDEACALFGDKPIHARTITDGRPKLCILEVRNGSGSQTGFPPSVYDNGRGGKEKLVWNEPFDPEGVPILPIEEIRHRAARLAFAAMALRAYPDGQGSRDEYCLKLAGALVALGWDADEGDDLLVHIATLAGDDEAEQRGGKVAKTIERREAGDEVSGLPAYLDYIEFPSAEKNIRKWFNLKRGNGSAVVLAQPDAIDIGTDNYERSRLLVAKLKEQGADIFIRGGELVRVRFWDGKESHSVDVPVGGTSVPVQVAYADIERLTWRVLRLYASKLGIRFCRTTAKGSVIPVADAPQDVFEDILKAPAEWGFQHLRALSLVPTLTRAEPGYDAATGLYLSFPKGRFPAVADAPTRAEAEAALQRLVAPVRLYEWERPRIDRAVFLSALMTAVVRASHRGLYPMFTFDAPKIASGKTKLAIMSGAFANGGVLPPIESWNPNPQEFEKKLVANLLAGVTCIIYDNVSTKIAGQELEGLLTAGEAGYKARILGVSENRRVPADVFVVATGNKLQYGNDMTRRVLRCGLEPKCEHPEDREFSFDPVEEMLRDFPARVADVLTILKAYMVSGERATVRPSDLGGFRLVQEALVWLGEADPLESRDAVRDRDADTAAKLELLDWLEQRFANKEFRAKDVAPFFDDLQRSGLVPRSLEHSRMQPSAIVGVLLSGLVGMAWGEKTFVEERDVHGKKKYRLENAEAEASVLVPI
jgi:hypothetical protein